MGSLRLWITTCLAAALVGVCVGAAYTAVNGHFDVPKASGALPGPSEQGTGTTRLAPAVEPDRTDSVARKAVPGHVNNAATAAKSQADKPAKAKAPNIKPTKVKTARVKPVKAGTTS